MKNMWVVRLFALALVVTVTCQSIVFAADAKDEEPLPPSFLAQNIMKILNDGYYDISRAHPDIMLEHAIRALEGGRVDLDVNHKDGALTLRIGEQHTSIAAGALVNAADAMKVLSQIQSILATLEVDGLERKERNRLIYGMYNGALQTIDPHTVLFPPAPAKEFDASIKGNFEGIGAYLQKFEGTVKIDRVMPGLPAEKAGIKDGDVIVAVDGEKVIGLSLSEAVRRIKGPRGSSVILSVERKPKTVTTVDEEEDTEQKREVEMEELDIVVIRGTIKTITVRSYRHNDIGYVRMDEFNGETYDQLRREILYLQSQKEEELKGFILDLRYNGGGRLDTAKNICNLFLDSGKETVRTVLLHKKPRIFSAEHSVMLDVPMMVLTSQGSASASEIVAGALQQNERAVVVGQKTFGKGSVQTWREVGGGCYLKYTIQKYQLAGGVSIQSCGVDPDIELVKHVVTEKGKVDLFPHQRRREADNEFALHAENSYHNESSSHLNWVQEYETDEEWEEHRISAESFIPEQEAFVAINLLNEVLAPIQDVEKIVEQFASRKRLATALAHVIAVRQETESTDLHNVLAARKRPVQWGERNATDAAQVSILYTGSQTVQAGERAVLTFEVHNSGAAVGQLCALVSADDMSPFEGRELIIGSVDNTGPTEATMVYHVPPRSYTGQEQFTVDVFQMGSPETILASLPVNLRIQGAPRPHFSYSWSIMEASGDKQISVDESAEVHITVVNDGTAKSEPVTIYVHKDDNAFVQLEEARWPRLKALEPQESHTIIIPFTIRSVLVTGASAKVFDDDEIILELAVEEQFDDEVPGLWRAVLNHVIHVPLNTPLLGTADGGQDKQAQQPLVTITDQSVENDVLSLGVQVEDDNVHYVAIFHEQDKVALLHTDVLKNGFIEHALPLNTGANTIRVVAYDDDRLLSVRYLRAWGSEKALSKMKAAPTTEKKVKETATHNPLIPKASDPALP